MKTLKILVLALVCLVCIDKAQAQNIHHITSNESRSFLRWNDVEGIINSDMNGVSSNLFRLNSQSRPGDVSLVFNSDDVSKVWSLRHSFSGTDNGAFTISHSQLVNSPFVFRQNGDLEVPGHLIVNGDLLDEEGRNLLDFWNYRSPLIVEGDGESELKLMANSFSGGFGPVDVRFVSKNVNGTNHFLITQEDKITLETIRTASTGSMSINLDQLRLHDDPQTPTSLKTEIHFDLPKQHDDSRAEIYTIGPNANSLDFGVANLVPKMRISSNGNVGIGGFTTTHPAQRLHVMGGNALFETENGVKVSIDEHEDNQAYLGTISNNRLYIGANNQSHIQIHPKTEGEGTLANPYNDYIRVGVGSSSININAAKKKKFSMFVKKGIISEDYAMADRGNWADYVFEENYQPMSLEELETYVSTEKHLPGIISEQEITENGYFQMGEVIVGQLKNLEEQVLHNIAQEKQLKAQQKQIEAQAQKLEQLERLVQQLLAQSNED